jgi:EamA domain-containing membrane protein RarD
MLTLSVLFAFYFIYPLVRKNLHKPHGQEFVLLTVIAVRPVFHILIFLREYSQKSLQAKAKFISLFHLVKEYNPCQCSECYVDGTSGVARFLGTWRK